MVAYLHCAPATASTIMREVYKRGLVSKRMHRHGLKQTVYWRQRQKCQWLRKPWRLHSDEQLGIDLHEALETL